MTINEARKILGKDSQGLSDEEILRDIEAAELLKNLFFALLPAFKNRFKKPSNKIPNMP